MFGLWILVSIMGVMSIPSEIKTEGHCDDPDAEWSCQLPCKATCHVRNFGNCGTVCKDDCYCKQDYILDSKNNKCVKVEDCFADQKKLVKN